MKYRYLLGCLFLFSACNNKLEPDNIPWVTCTISVPGTTNKWTGINRQEIQVWNSRIKFKYNGKEINLSNFIMEEE